MLPTLPAPAIAALAAKGAKGAKDLLVEIDRTSSQPATYAVAPAASLSEGGGAITVQIRRKHQ